MILLSPTSFFRHYFSVKLYAILGLKKATRLVPLSTSVALL